MKKLLIILIVLLVASFLAVKLFKSTEAISPGPERVPIEKAENEGVSNELAITITPPSIKQGEPALIVVSGTGTSTVDSLSFNGRNLDTFEYEGRTAGLVGIDLRMNPGKYPILASLSDGRSISSELVVSRREIVQAPLGIPEKLGGNTPESERELVNTLVEEGALISAIVSQSQRLWEGQFRLPLDPPITVTDTYGYSRLTGASSISHKGTDYRAAVGTPVYAMNSGEVRFDQFLRNYGNTVIIDHGAGLLTIYMHLSESLVDLGDRVERGEVIARSGDTGYVLGPHLHLTIRINGISIDPEKFMELFGS